MEYARIFVGRPFRGDIIQTHEKGLQPLKLLLASKSRTTLAGQGFVMRGRSCGITTEVRGDESGLDIARLRAAN
jgi:hypothetical protein